MPTNELQPTDAPSTVIARVLQVLHLQGRNGATIDEIAAALNLPSNSISSRVAVLYRRGLIRLHPERFVRKTRSDSWANAWMDCAFETDAERGKPSSDQCQIVPDPNPKPPPAEEFPPTPDSYGLRFHRIAAIATRLLEDGLTSPKAEKRVRRILTIATHEVS